MLHKEIENLGEKLNQGLKMKPGVIQSGDNNLKPPQHSNILAQAVRFGCVETPNPSESSSAILQHLPLAQSFWRCSRTSQAVTVCCRLDEEQKFLFSLVQPMLSFVSEAAFLGKLCFQLGKEERTLPISFKTSWEIRDRDTSYFTENITIFPWQVAYGDQDSHTTAIFWISPQITHCQQHGGRSFSLSPAEFYELCSEERVIATSLRSLTKHANLWDNGWQFCFYGHEVWTLDISCGLRTTAWLITSILLEFLPLSC